MVLLDTEISSKAMSIMNSFVNDIFERMADKSSRLATNAIPLSTGNRVTFCLERFTLFLREQSSRWRYKWLVGPPLLVEGYADPHVLTSLWLHRHSYKLPHFLVPTIFSTVGAPWTHQGGPAMASTVGLSKVFILDKYFHELQKFWETEKRLKDTSCDNEAEKLQQRLRSLSTELVTLRSRLQVSTGGPLTEDAIVRTMQARFYAREYFIHAGPVLFFSNPYQDLGNPLTLAKAGSKCQPLLKVVQEAVKLQSETGFPQSLVVTGASGSGKTYTSMLLLRQLFDVAGGGPETDAFKHLSAAFTVLRSLGSASTISNSESSRVGQFIEVQVSDGHLYRTKIHCYFLDQDRIIRPLPNEKNYHIFYQMLAGLSREERIQLHLENYTIHKLSYLNKGSCHQNEGQDFARFETWKSCLSVLGIPFQDVMRVLAAVLLLGNIQFVDGKSEVEIKGSELKSVGQLLSINSRHLQMGLTCRTRYIRGQSVKSKVDAQTASWTRDCLAKALYCRTFATIVRRANSLKRVGSSTLSSVSTESAQHHLDAISQHASTVDSSGIRSCKSMSVLNSAVRHATDGYIGIVDMFGFENIQVNKLEQLCINLCAETLQHFYNTHVFKSNIETCKEEAVVSESPVDYVDNVPCIDLISSLKSGLLNILDNECSVNGTPESYSQKVKQQHQNNPRWFECSDPRKFGVRHFHSNVVYDTTDFLDTNRDIIPDDVVCVFQKKHLPVWIRDASLRHGDQALLLRERAERCQLQNISHRDRFGRKSPPDSNARLPWEVGQSS
ncbi:Myo20 [Cordylochernes scorpioides]|uniref:Myo20 n=1 Tax=Cordylochernes scorpioides TaxID=51811 RepID=A0ABY6KY59_9ARAC|nr:Myo20 [Cordylochernes scorpioides]